MAQGVRIGRLAHDTGLSVDTIRFYEREGLLREPPRSEGGFRLYAARDEGHLRFIRRAQELGFSLGEVRELLSIQDERGRACTRVRGLIGQKLKSVRGKMESLKALEATLEAALDRCESAAARDACPVLEKFAGNKDGGCDDHEN